MNAFDAIAQYRAHKAAFERGDIKPADAGIKPADLAPRSLGAIDINGRLYRADVQRHTGAYTRAAGASK